MIQTELKRLREAAGLSVRAMADALGIPPSSYQHYENPDRSKKHYFPPEFRDQVARVLMARGVNARDLQAIGYETEDSAELLREIRDLLLAVASDVNAMKLELDRQRANDQPLNPSIARRLARR